MSINTHYKRWRTSHQNYPYNQRRRLVRIKSRECAKESNVKLTFTSFLLYLLHPFTKFDVYFHRKEFRRIARSNPLMNLVLFSFWIYSRDIRLYTSIQNYLTISIIVHRKKTCIFNFISSSCTLDVRSMITNVIFKLKCHFKPPPFCRKFELKYMLSTIGNC